jgi:hypothetical protein
MKWVGERVESFHHGETTQRRFPGLGNAVKSPLRAISFHPRIRCGGNRRRRELTIFARALDLPARLPPSRRLLPPPSPPSISFPRGRAISIHRSNRLGLRGRARLGPRRHREAPVPAPPRARCPRAVDRPAMDAPDAADSGRRGSGRKGKGRGGTKLGLKRPAATAPPPRAASTSPPVPTPPPTISASSASIPPTAAPNPAPPAASSSPAAPLFNISTGPPQVGGWGAMPPKFPFCQGDQQVPSSWYTTTPIALLLIPYSRV